MYVRFDGDPGFSSRNPGIMSDEEIEFRMGSGQTDFFPRHWTYHLAVLKEAMYSFLEDGRLPVQLKWHDDSF